MKRIFNMMMLLLIVVSITACSHPLKNCETEEEIREVSHKLITNYAKSNGFTMHNYDEICFQVIPLYNVDEELEQYKEVFSTMESKYKKLVKDKNSIFYTHFVNTYSLSLLSSEIEEALEQRKKFSDEDMIMVQFLYDYLNNIYDKVDNGHRKMVGYTGIWIYNATDNDGYEEEYRYYFNIPFDEGIMVSEIDDMEYENTLFEQIRKFREYKYMCTDMLTSDVYWVITYQEEYRDVLNTLKFILNRDDCDRMKVLNTIYDN